MNLLFTRVANIVVTIKNNFMEKKYIRHFRHFNFDSIDVINDPMH